MHTRLLLAAALLFGLIACSTTSTNSVKIGKLTITDPWTRASVLSGSMAGMNSDMLGAGYMTISNSGAADKLISVHTARAKAVELHTVTDNNGVMEMRQIDGGIEIPAGSTVQFKPGSMHMMLIGLTKQLKPGDTIEFQLSFEQAGEVTVVAQVRQ